MKKKIILTLMVITLSILAFGVINVSAETEGIYTYTVSNRKATITDCFDMKIQFADCIPQSRSMFLMGCSYANLTE